MKKSAWLLFAGFLACILFLNFTSSYCSDDCIMGIGIHISGGCAPERLGTLSNAWRENFLHGYRPVVHLPARIFAGCCDKWMFDIANTAMMGCFLFLLLVVAGKKDKLDFRVMALLLALVFFVLCKGESYLWFTGSFDYLWAGTATLAFCLIARRFDQGAPVCPICVVCCIYAFFVGWMHEAFSLSLIFAFFAVEVLWRKRLSVKKAAFWGSYIAGAVALVMVAGKRASGIPPFTFASFALNMLKIAVAVKAVWLLPVAYLLSSAKEGFWSRNAFSLYVILGNVLMIAAVGFNGERSLWPANLFAIVVIVREYTPPRLVAVLMAVALSATLVVCCYFGFRIKAEFVEFTDLYTRSADGVCYHDRVNCGIFARFFYQQVYTWENGGHGMAFARFHGKDIPPVAFSKRDYDLLTSGGYCVPSNRLPTSVEAYSAKGSNTIVVPLPEGTPDPNHVDVRYSFPGGMAARLKRELASIRNPQVAGEHTPRIVTIGGQRVALVSKRPGSDGYIREVSLDVLR